MRPRKPTSIGDRFTRLTVIGAGEYVRDRKFYLVPVRCDCGTEKFVHEISLRGGKIKSCGCYKIDYPGKRRHGMTNSRAHRTWRGMHRRCYSVTCKDYPNYGGRGIVVCDEWRVFENFYRDMGDPPEGCSIDRRDVNGNYSPANCRWASKTIQNRNTKKNIYVDMDGSTICAAEAARKLGVNYQTFVSYAKAHGNNYQMAVEFYGRAREAKAA